MKSMALKIGKVSLSILLCIIILIDSMIMFVLPTKELEIEPEIQVVETSNISDNKNLSISDMADRIKVTSRNGSVIKTEVKEKYTIYELIINQDHKLYFEDLGLLNEKMEYLLNNTRNVEAMTNELLLEDKDLLNSEGYIDKIIQYYIDNYPKVKTCFPTKSHNISSSFGKRSRGDFHTGLDLCGNYGDNIFAYKSGTVIKTQYSNVSYGNMILLQHTDGTQTRYAHLSSINVSLGEKVDCGEVIGKMGSTGNSTGNHLHFEIIINGTPVNPYSYIF